MTELNWKKSSFSGLGECVEVADFQDGVVVRSSNGDQSRHLYFTQGEWDAFIKGVKAGEFDG